MAEFLVVLSDQHSIILEEHFETWSSFLNFIVSFEMEPEKTSDVRDSFSTRFVNCILRSRITLLARRNIWRKEQYFTMKLKLRGNTFWQGSQNCLLCVQGISWEKRIVLKRLFCCYIRTFSVDFLDLRQTFWQVVRTVKNLSRVVFEETIFGDIAHYLYLSTWIFNKKLHFSHYFLEWLS